MTPQAVQSIKDLLRSKKWSTIDDFTDALADTGFFTKEDDQLAKLAGRKMKVRKLLKRMKDETGMPVFASIPVQDEKGKITHIYKQESLFNKNDYQRVIESLVRQSTSLIDMAKRYQQRAKERLGVQLKLWETDVDFAADPEDQEFKKVSGLGSSKKKSKRNKKAK